MLHKVDQAVAALREEPVRALGSPEWQLLPTTRLARSRALAVVGAALTGLAFRLAFPRGAAAAHDDTQIAPCFGYGMCHCCNGSTCCTTYCEASYNHEHCPGGTPGTQCWYTCWCATTWQCCDWHVKNTNQNTHCICRSVVTSCGGGC